jgi:hypothetical protein
MPSLSVLIPSRHEAFLLPTIQDVLAKKRGDTNLIVVLDGEWPIDPIPDHPDVHLVYHPVSIGQRAATNEAARISRADFLMKLDAHCAVDEGFDLKLMEPYTTGELSPITTTIPRLYNLHVFNRICTVCGATHYQGPMGECPSCHAPDALRLEMVWAPRFNRLTDFARFDHRPQFQYWNAYKRRSQAQGDLADVMCHVGAGWMMPRARYWDLGGLDEGHGSWGQMGIEISCKSWLSGGRQVVNKRTWYSHLFRTQPGFSFPYPHKERAAEFAREYSRRLWFDNAWSGQVRPLSWILRAFHPVPQWETEVEPEPTLGVVYYTDNRLDPALMQACQHQLVTALADHPLVSVSLAPIDLGTNIVLPGERGRLQMFRQILAGLEALTTEYACLCEHDCLYPPAHFDFTPPRRDRFYYNQSVWRVHVRTRQCVTYRMMSVSGCCASRQLLIDYYRALVDEVSRSGYDHARGYEPGVREGLALGWRSRTPYVDLRHEQNLTASRWSSSAFHDIRTCQEWRESPTPPGWDLRALGV